MKCKFFTVRTRKGIKYNYCRLHRKEITLSCCRECVNKEYKQYKPLKSRSNKLVAKEKKRFSIIYPSLSNCCVCGLKTGDYDERIKTYTRVEKNEVFSGSYRTISMEDGMVAPMCIYCHDEFHHNTMMNLKYKVKFQKEYMKTHTLDEFIKRYGQDFIFKLEQKKRGKDI